MNQTDIVELRLNNQYLLGEKFNTPQEAVLHLGAVQSQDYFGASWSLGQRVENATAETIEQAFNEGNIIRTHVMRPTWHFVAPEDLRWMQELTSSRVKQFMGHYNRKLELDDVLFKKTTTAIIKLLKETQFATRQEIKKVLTNIGITTDVQRLAHIIMWAELDAIICSGPRIGKQFTYALVEQRIKKHEKLTRDEALAELTKRYFTSHGPAQLKDFSWWSGLTIKDAQEGINMVKSTLKEDTIDGKTYWFAKETEQTTKTRLDEAPTKRAFLLSIYDEYTIAYNDRTALSGENYIEKMMSMGNALTAVMIFEGKVIGTWKRLIKKNTVEITLNPFKKLESTTHEAFEQAGHDYGLFLNLQTKII
ncbi:MAG TPA: winged helix DNA-binding domain-containing protein [Patescibacteria group bacterium]|nr:winged helix DNA-binding domain-containing protein [Patescibacteria group bacterium]